MLVLENRISCTAAAAYVGGSVRLRRQYPYLLLWFYGSDVKPYYYIGGRKKLNKITGRVSTRGRDVITKKSKKSSDPFFPSRITRAILSMEIAVVIVRGTAPSYNSSSAGVSKYIFFWKPLR